MYSQPHIGNWVGYIYWDVLVRLLRWQDIPVIRTQNITDVGHLTSDDDNGEDKMEKGARREGCYAIMASLTHSCKPYTISFIMSMIMP